MFLFNFLQQFRSRSLRSPRLCVRFISFVLYRHTHFQHGNEQCNDDGQDDSGEHEQHERLEQAVEQVIQHVGRALGATPFCRSSHFARLSADLPVYLRQSHAERDLAELGQQVTSTPTGAWQL